MLIGHKTIWERIKREAEQGKLHHAQLFIGPKHVGKTKTALLASSVLQETELGELGLRPIDTLLFLDQGESLSIEEIRGLLSRTGLTHLSPYFVVVIENLGRMKIEAVNALLKTLEEPPAGTIFFLTANREEDVPATLLSRCAVTRFHTMSDHELEPLCKDHAFQKELLLFAMGRPGKLFRLMQDSEYLEAHQKMHEDLKRFLDEPSVHAAYDLLRRYEENPLIQELLDILLHRARTLALHSGQWEAAERVESAKRDLEQNLNVRLVLENTLLPFVP